jgi:glycosyltransferase involved in cell wall biosynthesis
VGKSSSEEDPRLLGLGVSKISITVKTPKQLGKKFIKSITRSRAANKQDSGKDILYTSIFNPKDGRKNWEDIVTAFVYAFRDDAHATLLMKITYHELALFYEDIFTFFIELHPFACRLVFIHGYLSDKEYEQLLLNSHYIVNASRGEGQCLPLMEFMSSGVPAIAPANTAMLDYIDTGNAFVVDSSPDLTFWPHDPRQVFRTFWQRVDWESLYQGFLASKQVINKSPHVYQSMSRAAIASLQQFSSMAVARERFGDFIESIQDERLR